MNIKSGVISVAVDMQIDLKRMIDKCDIAVVYFTDVASNTRKHVDMLKRKGKTIINIADMTPQNLDNPLNLC